MKLRLSQAELAHFNAYLDRCPDCERLSAREVVLDLYDAEPPVSMNFVFVNGGIGIDGAFALEYSEADDGWYLGERIEDPARVRALLAEAGALPAVGAEA